MRILWITNIPSPYRVDFFNEIGKNVELTVVCENRGEADRDSSWLDFNAANFKIVFLCDGVKLDTYLNGGYDCNVVTNYYSKAGMKAVVAFKRRRIPYVIEGDGAFAGSGRGIKEALKKWLIKDADFVFSTSSEHDGFYKKYGVAENRIERYPFSSVFSKDICEKPISKDEKLKYREELGMREDIIILSVGQFIHRKGYDILIKAMAHVKNNNTGCYIVGGDPPQEYIDLAKENSVFDRVHFVGFKQKEELKKYYMAADLFVLPTREDIWGLVVNEAMSRGLPVVTTTRCIAGLELIKDSEMGQLVTPDDEIMLAEALEGNIYSSDERGMHILKEFAPYTIEKMAKVHLDVFRKRLL